MLLGIPQVVFLVNFEHDRATEGYCGHHGVICRAVFVWHDAFPGGVLINKDMVGLSMRRACPKVEGLHARDVRSCEPEWQGRIEKDVAGCESRRVGNKTTVGQMGPVWFRGIGNLKS